MSRDISSHAWRATTTRTHSPAYPHEEIPASDGVPRDRDRLRAHGAAHGVDHLDEPYQLLSSVTAPTAARDKRDEADDREFAEQELAEESAEKTAPTRAAIAKADSKKDSKKEEAICTARPKGPDCDSALYG